MSLLQNTKVHSLTINFESIRFYRTFRVRLRQVKNIKMSNINIYIIHLKFSTSLQKVLTMTRFYPKLKRILTKILNLCFSVQFHVT